MTELLIKQQYFSVEVGRLIGFITTQNLGIQLGECWRPQEVADIYAKQGKGISDSLHILRLAIDITLRRDGVLLNSKEDYEPIGIWWKNLSGKYIHAWGGDWGDIYHFSVSHNGIR